MNHDYHRIILELLKKEVETLQNFQTDSAAVKEALTDRLHTLTNAARWVDTLADREKANS